jgi:hypothetical protein
MLRIAEGSDIRNEVFDVELLGAIVVFQKLDATS